MTTFKDKQGLRAWKSHDWDILNRLHEKGYTDDPVSKAKSVMLTDEGAEQSKRLFEKHFMRGEGVSPARLAMWRPPAPAGVFE